MSGPTCPFCGAPWTAAMLAELDALSVPVSCGCCSGQHVGGPVPPTPTEDLCCAACGRAIFLKPAARASEHTLQFPKG